MGDLNTNDKEISNAIEVIKNAINDKKSEPDGDKKFENQTRDEISKRDTQFTELVTFYVKLTKGRNTIKEFFKVGFLLVMIVGMLSLICITRSLFDKVLSTNNIEDVVKNIPILITSLVSFVTAIIAVPTIIVKYLFNTAEDDNITKIITHTQEHDKSGRALVIHTTEKELCNEETNNEEQNQSA